MSNISPVTSLNEGRCDMDLRGALLSSSSGATSSHLVVVLLFSRVALYICWLCKSDGAAAAAPPKRVRHVCKIVCTRV